MKDFITTIKSFPNMAFYAAKIYRRSFLESKWYFIGFILLSLLDTFIPYIRNWTQGLLLNSLQSGFQFNTETKITLGIFFAVIILPGFLAVIKGFFNTTYRFKLNQYYDNEIIKKSVEIDPQLHENKTFNNLVNRVNSKGAFVVGNFQSDTLMFILDILTLIVISVTLYSFSSTSFYVLALTTTPILFVKIIYGKDSWYIWGNEVDTEKRNKYWEYKNYFEKFSSYIELKLTEAKHYFSLFRSNFLQEVFINQYKNETSLVVKSFVANIISQAGLGYVIYTLFISVVKNEIPIGSFVFVMSIVINFSNTLISIFKNLGLMYPDYMYIKDLFTYFDTEPIVKNTGKLKIIETPPKIEFKNVSFKYPETEKYVLKNFNLIIEKGDKLAVIGLNGAGKSTFVKLICRFYDVTEGEILLNGKNIKDYDLESWYSILGVLFQEYGQYHIPVEDLVSLGRYNGKIDSEKVENSLKIAEAEFVNSLPEKEKTMLGKHYTGGVDISVGQWQKLAIARMFYRDPAVMILDEPTSSIDAEAEAKIFETLEKFSREKTVIMISHRFSTVRNADKICVIKDSSLHEYGTHEELMRNNDEYARLFSLQAEGYK